VTVRATVMPPAETIRAAAAAIAARHPAAVAGETDVAIAALTLRVLGTVEAGHLDPEEATDIFVNLEAVVADRRAEEDISERAHELLLEGGWLHDEAIGYGPDHAYLRRLALDVLRHPRD
jgi:hypothetical protein